MAIIACAIKPDLITHQEVQKILGVSKSALYRLRQTEGFPKARYSYNKRKMHMPRVVFSKKEVEEWKELNSVKQD